MRGLPLDDLVYRAKVGEVTAEELLLVSAALTDHPERDAYKLLYVLGRAGARDQERLVAQFLDAPTDPQVAALALSILCTHWGLGDRYRASLLAFLRGRDWDVLGEARDAAVTAAGEYLRGTVDCEVLEALLAVAENDDDDLGARFAAEALARALGEGHASALPPAGESVERWTAVVRSRARTRLNAECPPDQS